MNTEFDRKDIVISKEVSEVLEILSRSGQVLKKQTVSEIRHKLDRVKSALDLLIKTFRKSPDDIQILQEIKEAGELFGCQLTEDLPPRQLKEWFEGLFARITYAQKNPRQALASGRTGGDTPKRQSLRKPSPSKMPPREQQTLLKSLLRTFPTLKTTIRLRNLPLKTEERGYGLADIFPKPTSTTVVATSSRQKSFHVETQLHHRNNTDYLLVAELIHVHRKGGYLYTGGRTKDTRFLRQVETQGMIKFGIISDDGIWYQIANAGLMVHINLFHHQRFRYCKKIKPEEIEPLLKKNRTLEGISAEKYLRELEKAFHSIKADGPSPYEQIAESLHSYLQISTGDCGLYVSVSRVTLPDEVIAAALSQLSFKTTFETILSNSNLFQSAIDGKLIEENGTDLSVKLVEYTIGISTGFSGKTRRLKGY